MFSDANTSAATRRLVVIGLVFAIVLETALQLLWKFAASRLPQSLTPSVLLDSLWRDPLPLVVVGVMLIQLVNWLLVLERVKLSFAQPVASLSYVTVCLLSAWLFGEQLDAVKLLGVLLVLIGVVLIGVGQSGSE